LIQSERKDQAYGFKRKDLKQKLLRGTQDSYKHCADEEEGGVKLGVPGVLRDSKKGKGKGVNRGKKKKFRMGW